MTHPALPQLNMLVSFHYYRTTDLNTQMVDKMYRKPRLFLDSGAWSAFTQGTEIDFDLYKQYIRRYLPILDVYCNLDDMRDPEVTWARQKNMEAEGLPALPVVHMGEPLDILRRYLDDGYRYIGLGRMAGRETGPVARWLIECFKIAEPYGAVYHGLGMTRRELLTELPFYSVDSSSWTQGFVYGQIKLFDRGQWHSVKLWDRPGLEKVGDLIRQMGYQPRTFWDRSRYHRSHLAGMQAASWARFAGWLRETLPPVPFPEGAKPVPAIGGPGLHLYLADSDEVNHVFADAGLNRYYETNTT